MERQSVWKDIWKELKKNKVAMVSVVLLAILIIAVLLAPLSPYDPYKLDASQKRRVFHPVTGLAQMSTEEIILPEPYMVEEFLCWWDSCL